MELTVMAFLNNFTCIVCRKDVFQAVHNSGKCKECRQQEYNKKKSVFLARRSDLSVEQRLSELESDIYDLLEGKNES